MGLEDVPTTLPIFKYYSRFLKGKAYEIEWEGNTNEKTKLW